MIAVNNRAPRFCRQGRYLTEVQPRPFFLFFIYLFVILLTVEGNLLFEDGAAYSRARFLTSAPVGIRPFTRKGIRSCQFSKGTSPPRSRRFFCTRTVSYARDMCLSR